MSLDSSSRHEEVEPRTLEDAFLQDIVKCPDDDTPRLIFADWLEENDQLERAEFIRIQCRLAEMDENDSQRKELKQREAALLKEHGAACRPLPESCEPLRSNIQWKRGFPDSMRCGASAFLQLALAVPTIRSLNIHSIPNVGLADFFASPQLAHLTTLDLENTYIGSAGVVALAHSEQLRSLTTLDLGNNHIGPAGAVALAHSPHFGSLTTLDLWNNSIRAAGAEALAHSPHFGSLTTLRLGDNNIGDAGAEALAHSPHFGSLTTLSLWGNNIGDDGAVALAHSPNLGSLTALDLGSNNIGDAGVVALAHSPHLGSLTTLDLWNNNIGDDGATALAHAIRENRFPALCDLSGVPLAQAALAERRARAKPEDNITAQIQQTQESAQETMEGERCVSE